MNHLAKKLYARVAGVLSIGFILASSITPSVFAQTTSNGLNLTTTPVVANLDTKPGQKTSTKIQVKNNNVTTERIKVSVLKFDANGTSGAPLITEPEKNDEFLKWVTFSENNFEAEPNVWKTIEVTISPPSTAAYGYYYAISFTRSDEQSNTGTNNISGSIAVPVLLNVEAPGAIRKADITKFTVNKNVFEFLPASFTVTLKNSGNTHVAPRGNIFISKGGKSLGIIDVNSAKGNILPNSTRDYSTDWSEGSPAYKIKKEDDKAVLDKDGQQIRELSWSGFDPSKLRFGKYHAKITMVYDDGFSDVATEAEIEFWVIPWRIIGFSILALLFIGAGLWAIVIRPLRKGIKKLPRKKKHENRSSG